MFDVVGGIATWLSICYPGNRCFRQDGTKDHLGSSCNETYTLASAFDHRSQLQNSSAQLRWGRSQDVVYWDSMGTDALHQGLSTGAIGFIPTECRVRGDHLFYRAMHPYGMPGFAIGSTDLEFVVALIPSLVLLVIANIRRVLFVLLRIVSSDPCRTQACCQPSIACQGERRSLAFSFDLPP